MHHLLSNFIRDFFNFAPASIKYTQSGIDIGRVWRHSGSYCFVCCEEVMLWAYWWQRSGEVMLWAYWWQRSGEVCCEHIGDSEPERWCCEHNGDSEAADTGSGVERCVVVSRWVAAVGNRGPCSTVRLHVQACGAVRSDCPVTLYAWTATCLALLYACAVQC